MKTKVELSEHVANCVRSLAPEPRRAIRGALRELQEDRGDIKQLEGELSDWCRLRIRSSRVIFRYEVEGNQRFAGCVFAECGTLVHEPEHD